MRKLLLASLLPLVFASGVTSAYTITAEKYQNSVATFNLQGTVTGGSIDDLYTSITYRQQLTPGPTTAFDAWCVEPLVNDSPGPYTYQVSNLYGSSYLGGNLALQAAIERLWTVAENATGAPTLSTGGPLPFNAAQLAAAFQISIWELVVDGVAWNLSGGGAQIAAPGVDAFTDGVRNLASNWLTLAFDTDGQGNYLTPRTTLEYLDTAVGQDGRGQDHIRPWIPGQGGDDPLPLPGVAWLLLAGAAFGLRVKSKR